MSMRVTDLGLANDRVRWVRDGRAKTAEQEAIISSGRKIDTPSDDPAAAAQLMRHDIRLQRLGQYQRNTGKARLWVESADGALQSASNNLLRAKTVAIQAGNDTLGTAERDALAADIRSISKEILSVSNTQISGRAIFSGTSASPYAYDHGHSYQGDPHLVELALDSFETVTIGAPGPEVFGTPNPADPANGDIFEIMESLALAIESGVLDDIRVGIESVDLGMEMVGSALGRIGAISQQLDAAELRQSGEKLSVQSNVSKLRDTDIAEAVIRLRTSEASFQATLSSTARGLSMSLLDFLR